MVFAIPGLALLGCGLIVSIIAQGARISDVDHIRLSYAAVFDFGHCPWIPGHLLFIFAKLMAVESGLHPPRTKFGF
jgi:hypothetical protein